MSLNSMYFYLNEVQFWITITYMISIHKFHMILYNENTWILTSENKIPILTKEDNFHIHPHIPIKQYFNQGSTIWGHPHMISDFLRPFLTYLPTHIRLYPILSYLPKIWYPILRNQPTPKRKFFWTIVKVYSKCEFEFIEN